jgi:hypothetical protein
MRLAEVQILCAIEYMGGGGVSNLTNWKTGNSDVQKRPVLSIIIIIIISLCSAILANNTANLGLAVSPKTKTFPSSG